MTRRMFVVAAVLAAALVTGSCQVKLGVSDITLKRPGEYIDGVPFRVRETHTIRVFQWNPYEPRPKGIKCTLEGVPPTGSNADPTTYGHFKQVFETQEALANPSRLFALNFRAESFSDHDFVLQYNEDNTLTSVQITGTPSAQGLSSLGTESTSLVEGFLKREDAIRERESKLREYEKQDRQREVDLWAARAVLDDRMDSLRTACADFYPHRNKPDSEEYQKYGAAIRRAVIEVNKQYITMYGTTYIANPYAVDLPQYASTVLGKPR